MPTHTSSIGPSPDDLLAELALVRVLEPEQVAVARAAGVFADDDALAEFLVAHGLLNQFQADRAVAGKADRLTARPVPVARTSRLRRPRDGLPDRPSPRQQAPRGQAVAVT